VLAIDFGTKRLGLALSDPLLMSAQAIEYILNDDHVMNNLKKIIEQYEVDHILLGLPKNQHGNDSEMATLVRQFAETLAPLSCPISYWDERFSTQAVQKQLIQHDVSRKKRKEIKDSLSAAFFLQGFLDRYNNQKNKTDITS
tara:strand:+ start:55 stop:480 length:426 start_codon:yes stop_codon:yes gene_type:complete